jgi:hypothetical protein
MSRSITIVLTEEQAVDVAEAVSMRKNKLQQLISTGVEIRAEKIDHLSAAGLVLDRALADEVA